MDGTDMMWVLIPIEHNGEATRNSYLATAVVRIKDGKQYLYDIINIKRNEYAALVRRLYGRKPLLFYSYLACFGVNVNKDLWG